MVLQKRETAGTLESSDTMVTAEPGSGELEIFIESIVMQQFGDDIRKSVMEVCTDLGVASGRISVKDRGALECTIKARVETALLRSGGNEDD